MNAEKLLKLADFLETLPPERFDYNQWANGLLTPDCGTKGCALGWATVVFPEDLKLVQLSPYRCVVTGPSYVTPDWDASTYAGTRFFDITTEQFDRLFVPEDTSDFCCEDCNGPEGEYIAEDSEVLATPAYVAAKIRTFVEENA